MFPIAAATQPIPSVYFSVRFIRRYHLRFSAGFSRPPAGTATPLPSLPSLPSLPWPPAIGPRFSPPIALSYAHLHILSHSCGNCHPWPFLAIPRHSSPFLGDFGLGGFFCHPLNKYLPFFCYMTFTRVPMRVYIGHTGFFDILWHHYNFIIIFFVSPSQIFTDSIETTLIFFVYLYFAFLSLSLSLSL